MQNKLFLKAADICELLEVKQTSAYEIIGNLNKELEEQEMLKRMRATGYESYAEAAGAFLQESDYIPTQMETQNSIKKKRTGEVRLPSDNKAKN